MRRLAVFVLTLGALTAWAEPALAQKPRAERPTYTLGDKWIRSDGVYDLIRIEKDLYIFSAGPGREIHLGKDLGVAKIQQGGDVQWQFDPLFKLPWPLEVGKWGKTNGVVRFPAMRVGASSAMSSAAITWAVEAYEEVNVPAGSLKAFRISLRLETGMGPMLMQRGEVKVWYAPAVQQFVKAEGQDFGLSPFQVVAIERPETGPLQVALADPKDQARFTREEIVVAGRVTGGKGVAGVTVTLNGREVSRQEDKTGAKPEMVLKIPVRLSEGRNVLLVTAADPEGTTRQEARTLFYDKPAPPAPAVPGPTRQPAPGPAAPAAPAPPTVASPPPLQVTLSSPRDQARVERDSLALAGLASGGHGVSRVVVTLNGVEVSRQVGTTPEPAVAVNLPLKLQEGVNTLVVTATDARGAVHQEVRTLHYDKLVPLTVAFRYPEDRSRVSEEASVVAAVVTSSKGVARVSVMLNGTEVHQQSERAPLKSVLVTVPVTLREGANAVAVSAAEPDGTVLQEVRTVIYDKPKVAVAVPPPPPVAPPVTRDRWAVIIGVGRYESPDIPRLRYTIPDAEAIYQVLIGPADFKKEHVLLLTDKTEKKPTFRNIRWALGTFLARSARKDDTVLIFFAGHGAPEVDPRGIERDGLAKYLVPIDADPDDLYATAFQMDELQTVFGRIEAERVVAFLDSCYSGAAGGRTFTSKKTRASHVDDLFLERLTRSKGRAIITASRPAEVSIELAELGHGIFTYYLVQGLRGAADLNRDGIVSLQELYEYLEQQVTQKSRAVGGSQHPVMKGELEGVLPLVKVQR